MEVKYHPEWKEFFVNEQKKPYFTPFIKKIIEEYQNYQCYPQPSDIFRIFTEISPFAIKVVIIGQDPYHNPGQANGLAFSVHKNVKLPPSLNNIFKELHADLNIDHFSSGDLNGWLRQGVFLYNTIGTVRSHQPLSHQKIGWLEFSQNLLIFLNKINPDIIYVLWGAYAKSFDGLLLNRDNILRGAHPSPFSYQLFKDKKFFSKINELLLKNKKTPIKWEM